MKPVDFEQDECGNAAQSKNPRIRAMPVLPIGIYPELTIRETADYIEQYRLPTRCERAVRYFVDTAHGCDERAADATHRCAIGSALV
jgi:hypothetical protein